MFTFHQLFFFDQIWLMNKTCKTTFYFLECNFLVTKPVLHHSWSCKFILGSTYVRKTLKVILDSKGFLIYIYIYIYYIYVIFILHMLYNIYLYKLYSLQTMKQWNSNKTTISPHWYRDLSTGSSIKHRYQLHFSQIRNSTLYIDWMWDGSVNSSTNISWGFCS